MMRKITYVFLLFLGLLCYTIKGNGQLITGAEYFINADPGVGKGIAITGITGINNVNADFEIPSGNFHPGFNQLFIRLLDQNNNWSVTEQRTFYVDNTLNEAAALLTAAEYFLDTDPGIGNGSAFTIQNRDSIGTLINIPANLASGFHQLFIRVKDQNNDWSIAEQRTFYIDNTLNQTAPLLSAAEYFIDTDPGVGNGSPFTIRGGDSAGSLIDIPIDLAGGFHQLFIRVKDQTNNWSIAEQRTFHIDASINDSSGKGPVPLIAAEYYINAADAGVGKNTPVSIIKSYSVDTNYIYEASNLAAGEYTMNLRVEDSAGNWSIVESRPFTVTSGGPVPVTLTNFLLNCDDNKVILSWQTATEISSSSFEIQKSSDGLRWNTAGSLNAAGNSATIKNYQFTDEHARGIVLYRLRQLDKDGRSIYSPILKSSCTFSEVQLQVYPVPSKDEMNVLIQTKNDGKATIVLIDVYGNIIRKINKTLIKGANTVLLNIKDIPSGGYFLKVEGIDGLSAQKIIISR